MDWLNDIATVPKGQHWWLTDPKMATRRNLIKEVKLSGRRRTVHNHNHGYFDFEPGMDSRLGSLRNQSNSGN